MSQTLAKLLGPEYEYVECCECHRIVSLTEGDLSRWALKPSLRQKKPILGVAVGVCPSCQRLDLELSF